MGGGIYGRLRARAEKLAHRRAIAGNRACRHSSLTYEQLFQQTDRLAAGFHSLGAGRGFRVGLIAENSDLWLLSDLSLLAIGAIDVPRGGDTSAEEIAFCVNHSGCHAAIVEEAAHVEKLGAMREAMDWIVVLRGDAPSGTLALDDVLARGDELLARDPDLVRRLTAQTDEQDPATIIYTSGTTGNPKGVMLTHANIIHNITIVPEVLQLHEGGRFLSFLPSWHSFERALEYIVLDSGMELHYSSKWTVKEDFLRVRPDFVAGVPRLWETFYNTVISGISNLKSWKKHLVSSALVGSRQRTQVLRRLHGLTIDEHGAVTRLSLMEKLGAITVAATLTPAHFLADLLVYRKLRRALGGRIGAAISGGGPLPAHVDEFFTRAKIPLLNGYGLTESSPVISVRLVARNILGTIGPPIPATEVRIVDDAGRDIGRGRRGNIQARGPQIMHGYWRNDDATRMALTEDGWLNTGDVGMLSSEGDIMITGRAKDTIVLRGGENVEPEPLEAVICASSLISDAVVVGHGQKTLGALLIPDIKAARAHLGLPASVDDLAVARRPELKELLRREVSSRVSKERGYRAFERIGRIVILERPFSIEDGTLTATLKKKRNVIEQLHAELIRDLFEGGGERGKAEVG